MLQGQCFRVFKNFMNPAACLDGPGDRERVIRLDHQQACLMGQVQRVLKARRGHQGRLDHAAAGYQLGKQLRQQRGKPCESPAGLGHVGFADDGIRH